MGKSIVRELGLGRSNDTLSRWMSHRVAELMDLAEHAPAEADKEEARRECADLILRLWARRTTWPQGQPLSRVLPLLRRLTEEPQYDFHWREPDGSWAGLLPRLERLQDREWRVCIDAALANIPQESVDPDRRWLAEHADDLTPEERESQQRLIQLVDCVYAENFLLDAVAVPRFAALPADERTRHVHDALEKIAAERQRLISAAASSEEPDSEDDLDEEQEEANEHDVNDPDDKADS